MLQKTRYFFSTIANQFMIKKFYKQIKVDSEPTPSFPLENFSIKLDNKSIKSPNNHFLKGSSSKLKMKSLFLK